MGRLEKQIIVGAIALVAVLLGIVVLTGVKPVDAGSEQHMKSEWMPPEVPLSIGDPSRETLENDSGSSIGLGGAELSLGSEPKQLSTEAQEKSETLTSPPASQEEPQGSGELATLDAVVIESNYDPQMLEDGLYPEHLKQRIRGPGGHLSNKESADLLSQVDKSRLQWACLAHLSEKNNCPEIALNAHRELLGDQFPLYVASRYQQSECMKVESAAV